MITISKSSVIELNWLFRRISFFFLILERLSVSNYLNKIVITIGFEWFKLSFLKVKKIVMHFLLLKTHVFHYCNKLVAKEVKQHSTDIFI